MLNGFDSIRQSRGRTTHSSLQSPSFTAGQYMCDSRTRTVHRIVARGQSNLAKAALNAPHTLHALDFITIAIPRICRGSQKLNVGHVIQTQTRI